jgi:hypothetical protein
MINDISKILKKNIKKIYNMTLRPHLPRKIGILNGVPARYPRLFDESDIINNYEAALIGALRETVKSTDHVVIVGGGFGVSSVVASRYGSHVTVFEAGDRYEILCETLEINDVSDSITPKKSLVGPQVSVKGSVTETTVSPADLPACDVLELDCEGSEVEILRNLEIRPRVIIVECHAVFDAPESTVRRELDRLGYIVVNREAEVPERGIFILTAMRENEL